MNSEAGINTLLNGEIMHPAAADQHPRDFRTTHWSVVLEAGNPSAGQALETLCRAYWYPLYAFVRRRGYPPHEAEDLTQSFFANLLAGTSLATVHPEKGRFRTFLLASLKNFLSNEWDKSNRLKRGGGQEIISWDSIDPESRFSVEPAGDVPAEVQFDREWAQSVVRSVANRLKTEAERDGTLERYELLKNFLAGEPPGTSYAEAGQQLKLSEGAVKSAIFRLRRRYGEFLREEIANTLTGDAKVEDEIKHLFAALAS